MRCARRFSGRVGIVGRGSPPSTAAPVSRALAHSPMDYDRPNEHTYLISNHHLFNIQTIPPKLNGPRDLKWTLKSVQKTFADFQIHITLTIDISYEFVLTDPASLLRLPTMLIKGKFYQNLFLHKKRLKLSTCNLWKLYTQFIKLFTLFYKWF